MEDFWIILAAIAAFFSALYAYRANRISKKSYKLSKKSYTDKQANFNLYLIDSFRWIVPDSKKILLFHCTINNISESKSSYKCVLSIEYIREDNSVSRVILEHNPKLLDFIKNKSLTPFPIDIRIEEKGIESKWFVFEQPSIISKELRIEKYLISLSDPEYNTETIECYMLKDIKE